MDRTVNVSATQQPNKELDGKLEAKDNVSTTDDETSYGSHTLELAERFFHGALFGKQVLNKVTSVLEKRNITSENTLYAQSVCPDEINHEGTEITNLLAAYFGKVFHLGGLAVIPFTGRTGFGAFSAHVPDDGNLYILLATHVGITPTDHLGMYERQGQQHREGAACGAAVGALHLCLCGKVREEWTWDPAELQMNYFIHEISPCCERIKEMGSENERSAGLAHETWKIAKNMLDEIVHTRFGAEHSKLVVLSGIQVSFGINENMQWMN